MRRGTLKTRNRYVQSIVCHQITFLISETLFRLVLLLVVGTSPLRSKRGSQFISIVMYTLS